MRSALLMALLALPALAQPISRVVSQGGGSGFTSGSDITTSDAGVARNLQVNGDAGFAGRAYFLGDAGFAGFVRIGGGANPGSTIPLYVQAEMSSAAPEIRLKCTQASSACNIASYNSGDDAIQFLSTGSTYSNAGIPWTSAGVVRSSSGLTNGVVVAASAGPIVFAQGSTPAQSARFDTSGNLCIGTATSCSNPLTVTGNASISGSLTTSGTVITSTATGISAAGTTQGTATALSNSTDIHSVSTATAGSADGVRLPSPAVAGRALTVCNTTNPVVTIKVYPATGHTIDTNAANTAVSMSTLFQCSRFISISSSAWVQD